MKKILQNFFMVLIFLLAVGTTYTTITIDGNNDFESDEAVLGTGGSIYYITWDANYLYLGAQNSDIDDNISTKWLYFYLDSDPQLIPITGTGTTTGLTYNTQQPTLPFTANYHFRWKTDNTYINLQEYNGSTWVNGTQTGISAFQTGQYVEIRIPLANIGSPTQIYLVGAMINEVAFGEWTYYQTPQNGHTDGYDPNFISRFGFTLTSGISPNDPAYVDAALPVELTTFSASKIGSTVKLTWNTATEINNFGFEVERSVINDNWTKIGFVNGNGNSSSPKSYTFEDKNLTSGKYSYRLKQIDNNGSFEYSKTIKIDLGTPEKFELSQNYPNPFNPTTTISFSLPESGNVKLTLYNLIGQVLGTIVNEYKESGIHTINFDGSELNSGIYIYKLQAGSFVETKKMILMK